MFDPNKTSISKKNAVLYYVGICGFFGVVSFFGFNNDFFSIVFEISIIFIFLGLFIVMFFNDELNEKYHFKTEFSWSYQSEALNTLALSTTAVAAFFILFSFI